MEVRTVDNGLQSDCEAMRKVEAEDLKDVAPTLTISDLPIIHLGDSMDFHLEPIYQSSVWLHKATRKFQDVEGLLDGLYGPCGTAVRFVFRSYQRDAVIDAIPCCFRIQSFLKPMPFRLSGLEL